MIATTGANKKMKCRNKIVLISRETLDNNSCREESMDQDDFCAIADLVKSGWPKNKTPPTDQELIKYILTIASVRGNGKNNENMDKDRRVCELDTGLLKQMTELLDIKQIPDSIGNLTSLEECSFSGLEKEIRSLPTSIGYLENLKVLDLSNTRSLFYLPEEIGNLKRLEKLHLSHSCIDSLPESIGGMSSLTMLDLTGTGIELLPSSFHRLKSLKQLILNNSALCCLPEKIGDLQNLEFLALSYTYISELPSSMEQLQNLKMLGLSGTDLPEFPEWIGNLANLNGMCFKESDITAVPRSIGRLKHIRELHLYCDKKLSQLPEELGDMESLRFLCLTDSGIEALPRSLGRLLNLRELRLPNTKQLSHLPEEICNLKNLRHLDLSGSGITSLPWSKGQMKGLQRLNLEGSSIPELQGNDSIRTKFLLDLVRSCPSLGAMDDYTYTKGRIGHALACNRARSRGAIGNNTHQGMQLASKLWPDIICNAHKAFAYYDSNERSEISDLDAIYALLVNRKESFAGVLIHRNTDSVVAVESSERIVNEKVCQVQIWRGWEQERGY